jgi:hypothetical protein
MDNFTGFYFGEDYKIAFDIGSSLRNEYARYLISQWFDEAKKKRSFELDPKDLDQMVQQVKTKNKLSDDDVDDIAEELKSIAQEIIKSAEKVA